jgi:hypothetical protein
MAILTISVTIAQYSTSWTERSCRSALWAVDLEHKAIGAAGCVDCSILSIIIEWLSSIRVC